MPSWYKEGGAPEEKFVWAYFLFYLIFFSATVFCILACYFPLFQNYSISKFLFSRTFLS